MIVDPNGKTIKRIDTFSDRFGVFKIDNFRIPSDAKIGVWTINAKSGANFEKTVAILEECSNAWVPPDRFPTKLLKAIEYEE